MKIRVVDSIEELQRHFGLPCDGDLLEPDLDVVENDTEVNGRKRRDAEVLCTLAANAIDNVLELGTSHGRGAFKLASNLSHGLVCHTVNILPEQHDASGGKMVTHLIDKDAIGSYYRDRGLKNVEQLYANTARWEIPAHIRNLGMVFVDAAHDEENVYLDSKLVWDRIAPGGFIVWHDFSELSRRFDWIDASMRGVERFLREYGLQDLEVVNLRHSWCGVLRKPQGVRVPTSAKPVVEVPEPAISTALAVGPAGTAVGGSSRSLRIAMVYPWYDEGRRRHEELFAAEARALGYDVEAIGLPCPGGWWHFPKLDAKWRSKSRDLLEMYEKLEDVLRNKDVMVASGGPMLHPEFVRSLSTYNVWLCSDDPESSATLSQPAAPAFDFAFPVNIACVDDYRRWGCRHVDWMFSPVRREESAPDLDEEAILTGERDLDVVLLCERVFNLSDRAQRIERLVREFPKAFVRGPGWPGGAVEAPPVYRRARIGWNLHNSTGPANTRVTMLPAFGVLQICDNKAHLGRLFELDKEVVGFDSVEEAIEKTRYYLEHEDERRRIALAGWKRAKRDYSTERWWHRLTHRIAPFVAEKFEVPPAALELRSEPRRKSDGEAADGAKELPRALRQDGGKPRVLLLADRRGWAYDTAAQAIRARLSDEFEFRIAYVRENPDLTEWDFDLLYVFFWGETYHRRYSFPASRVIKEISSHRWANEDAYGRLTPEAMAAKFLGDAGTLTATSRRLQEIFSPIRPVHWCPNGFEPSVFRRRGERTGPLRIGWAGNRNDPCKGLNDVLLPAAGEDFELLVAGGDLDSGAMGEFYSKIDVLCVASTAEGEPLTLVEGMAAGVFPVAVDVGIVPELVRHRENGLVVNRDPAAFRAAFQWCHRNANRVRSAGDRNANDLASSRRWDDVAPRWRTALRSAWYTHTGVSAPSQSTHPRSPASSMQTIDPAATRAESFQSTAAGSMKDLKESYFEHLKAMNPAGAHEATYQACLFYYRGELEPLLPASRQARCLDIGCGFGHLPRFLLERGFRQVGGVEIDARLHSEARAYVGDRMEFLHHGDAIPFLEAHESAFDFVTLFDVIEHFTLDDGVALARRILKSLKPGGRVVMRTPNMANIFGSYSRHMDLTHQIGFTEQSLAQMLRLSGYSDVGVHVPQWDPAHPLTAGLVESANFHRRLFGLQDRSTPKSFEKNIVVHARR